MRLYKGIACAVMLSGAIAVPLAARTISVCTTTSEAEVAQPRNNILSFERSLLNAFAEAQGHVLAVGFHPLFSDMMARTAAGACDMAVGMITHTREREERLAFSDAYFPVRLVLVEPPGRSTQKVEDLAGKTVLAVTGTLTEEVLAGIPGLTIVPFSVRDARFWDPLKNGSADAMVIDSAVVLRIFADNPELHVSMALSPRQDYAFAFPRDSPLTAEVDAFLHGLKTEGGYRRLLVQHFGEEISQVIMDSFEEE